MNSAKMSSNPFALLNRVRGATTVQPTPTVVNGIASIPPVVDKMPKYAAFLSANPDVYVCVGNAFNKEKQVYASKHTPAQLETFMKSFKRLLRCLCVMKMVQDGYMIQSNAEFWNAFQTCSSTEEETFDAKLEQVLLSAVSDEPVRWLDVASYIQSNILDGCNVQNTLGIASIEPLLIMLLHKGANTRVFTRIVVNYMLRTIVNTNISKLNCNTNQLMIGYQVTKDLQPSSLLITPNVIFDDCWLIDFDSGVYMIVLDDQRNVLQHYQTLCNYL